MTSERHGRPVFYGAMITEGIVALIWAAAATYFFHENGMGETNAAVVVDAITKDWLGTVGGFLAILGVIAAPITSGDTAFRSARLIVADFLGMEQKSMRRRLYICIPMFLAAIGLLLYSLSDKEGFDMIWRYFAWTNQTLSVFTLWAPTADKVRLNLFASGEGGEPEERLEMRPSDDGTWRVAAERDLKGTFYTFQIAQEEKRLDVTPSI